MVAVVAVAAIVVDAVLAVVAAVAMAVLASVAAVALYVDERCIKPTCET